MGPLPCKRQWKKTTRNLYPAKWKKSNTQATKKEIADRLYNLQVRFAQTFTSLHIMNLLI